MNVNPVMLVAVKEGLTILAISLEQGIFWIMLETEKVIRTPITTLLLIVCEFMPYLFPKGLR